MASLSTTTKSPKISIIKTRKFTSQTKTLKEIMDFRNITNSTITKETKSQSFTMEIKTFRKETSSTITKNSENNKIIKNYNFFIFSYFC